MEHFSKYVEDLISENILKSAPIKKSRTVKIILNEDDQIVVKEEEVNTFLEGSDYENSTRVKPLEKKKQKIEESVSDNTVAPKVLPIKKRVEFEE